jgi:O-antigen ligase
MKIIAKSFLLVFVFSLPWQGMIFIPGVGSISRLLGYMLLAVAILYLLLKRQAKIPSLLIIVIILYIFWSALSYIWSVNEAATLRRIFQNIQFLALVWLIWEICDTHSEYLKLMQVYIIGLMISFIDMIITFLIINTAEYRIAAGDLNPNRMSILISFGIPLAWYLVIKQKNNIMTIINIIFLPLAIFSIILTASRTGFILGILALAIIPFTYQKISYNGKIIILLMFVSMFLTFGIFHSSILERVDRNIERMGKTSEMLQEGNFSYRQEIWKIGIQAFYEKPITGVGSNAFRYDVYERAGRMMAPHGTYIALLVETGIPGLLLFFLYYWLGLFRSSLYTTPREFYS